MSLTVKHKESNSTSSMIYNYWIHEIVNKGEANNYILLEYPDLVHLVIIQPDGKIEKDRILERDKAMKEIEKFSNALDYVEIDVKELIANDIKISNNIGKKINKTQSWLSSLFRFISFNYLHPQRILDKQRKRHITMVVLMIVTILAMFVIAYFQGIFDVGV